MNTWDVFISYSRLDKAVVAPIAGLLRVTDAAVFRGEESIPLGKKWDLVISESIQSCRTLLVFWSAAAADSKAVEAEYTMAIEALKDVVPVLIDDTPLTDRLSEYQAIDFRGVVQAGKNRAR